MVGEKLRRSNLGFFVFIAVLTAVVCRKGTQRQNRIVVGNEDFYLVRQGFEKEFWLSFNGYLASDKTVHDGYYKAIFRQITDGSSLYEGVFDTHGTLRDCEVKTQRNEIEHFVRTFQREARSGKRGANVTVSYTPLVPGQIDHDLLTFIKSMINFPQLKRECRKLHESLREEFQQQRANRSRQKRSFTIFPGTKWCGSGSTAKHDNDLGSDVNADRCCREHDKCPYYIMGFETKWHLYNSWFGTVSHCDCDNSFKTCLRSARTGVANLVGKMFFNLIKRSCFVLRKRKVCVKRSWWGKCNKRERKLVAKYKQIKKYKPL